MWNRAEPVARLPGGLPPDLRRPKPTSVGVGRSSEGAPGGAGEGNRTLVISLEGCCSTIELHPRRARCVPWRAGRAKGREQVRGGPPTLKLRRASCFAQRGASVLRSSESEAGQREFCARPPTPRLRRASCFAQRGASVLRSSESEAGWWGKQDSNLRRLSQRIYSPPPLPLGTFPRSVRPLSGRREAVVMMIAGAGVNGRAGPCSPARSG